MFIDVSEIKSFRTCRRKHRLSSRNGYHLQTLAPKSALAMGSLFHEALAQLYLGANFEAVMKLVKADMAADDVALLNMIQYYDQVLLVDLASSSGKSSSTITGRGWQVLEVEYKFSFPGPVEGVDCVGAIDLIVYEPSTNGIIGVEHKTCSKFRDKHTILMDEQPRVYYEALERYIGDRNLALTREWLESDEVANFPKEATATNGGIIISETQKLLRKFANRRTVCKYTEEDRQGFWNKWTKDLLECRDLNEDDQPDPSYWGCQMCDFKSICADTGYASLPSQEYIAQQYGTEFQIRKQDHLEEKLDWSERLGETSKS